MRRVSYALLALAAAACSIGSGIMVYHSAVEADVQAQIKAETMERLAQETWYLPLGEKYSGIHAIKGAGRELYGAFAGDEEVLMDRSGKVTLKIPKSMTVFDMSLGWISGEMDTGSEGGGLLLYQDKESEKVGYMDLEGNVILKARYDLATAFDDGYAVREADIKGCAGVQAPIDESGQVLYDTSKLDRWPDLYTSAAQVEGRYFLLKSRGAGGRRLFDARKKAVIKEWPSDEPWFELRALGEERFAKTNGDGFLLLDENFETMEESTPFVWMDRFSEGLCYVRWTEAGKVFSGYIDGDGQVQLQMPDVFYGGRFTEGKAFLWEEDKVCVIDRTGRKLFEKQLSKPLDEDSCRPDDYADTVPAELEECWYRDGLAICWDGTHFGIIDKRGDWVIRPAFSRASFSGKDAAVVEVDGKEGIWKAGGNHA